VSLINISQQLFLTSVYMTENPSTFIVYGPFDIGRSSQVDLLKEHMPTNQIIEPIFPRHQKVPFLSDLLKNAFARTNRTVLPEEIGVFMSHRKIWRIVEKLDPNKHYLILESDSKLIDPATLKEQILAIEKSYDIFFWGAWNNHVSIKRSTTKKVKNGYRIGTPMIKSLYGTYGYSLNPLAAKYLLKQSKQINHPVDYYKYYVNPNEIKMGAIQPEVVSTWQTTESSVRLERPMDKIKRIIIIKIFHLRNQILAYFC
jgi:GR25 family glycosyltransferase involved in LPS biosynthesis